MSRRRANAQRKPADRASVRPSSRRIGRVSVILAALIAVAAGIWMAARLVGRSESSRANILLITIDTLRWDRVGVYGYRRAATPVLDGLAARGVKFETAIAHAALTAPSHASMLTGLIPPRHGVRDNGAFVLSPNVPSLAAELRRAGYETAGFISGFPLDRRFGFSIGFDLFDDALPRGPGPGSRAYVERRADDTTTRVLAWLDGRGRTGQASGAARPWFLWVHYFDPHAAYEPPAEFAARFADSPYDGEVAFVDAQIGRLFQHLERRGDPAGTITLVTADHGESLGDHGEQTHGIFVYDATLRVPFLLAGPGIPPGVTSAVVARGVDVMPTLADLAGVAVPAGLDGRSLRPALTGKTMDDAPAYVEGLVAERHLGWAPLHGMRTAAWKFIDAPRQELYDLRADVAETTNRIDQRRDLADALRAQVDAARKAQPAGTESSRPDAETTARLRALGYLGGNRADGAPSQPPDSAQGRRDPKDGIDLINTLETAVALSTADPARAVPLLQSVLREDPRIELARRHLAIALVHQTRHAEAIEVLLRLRSENAATAEDLVLLSESLRVTGRAADAQSMLAEATALDPRSPEPALTLARSLLARQQPAEAAAAYRRVLDIAPEHPEALTGLGDIALAQGDLAGAAAWFERTLARDPHDGHAIFRLAVVRARQGRTAEALPLFRTAVERDPAHPDALAGLAAALAKTGRPSDAIPYFQRAIDAGARTPAVFNGLGLARLESGDQAGALAAFRMSLTARPDQPEIARLARELSARRQP